MPKKIMVKTKYDLKEVRPNEGLSASQLASYSELSERTILDIENRKRPGSAVTWGKIIIGLNKNPRKSRTWKLGDFK